MLDKGKGSLPQNTGHPKRDKTSDHWQNSILVGPQTAGIPVVHNEDGWVQDSDSIASDSRVTIPPGGEDRTGGAINYFNSQRRKR